jgi:hypothetical protein
LLRKPPHFTGLDKHLSQLELLLKQLDEPDCVIDIGTVKAPAPTTILIEAAKSAHLAELELVLAELSKKTGFDLNQTVPNGAMQLLTPVHASCCSPSHINLFLEAGADVRFLTPNTLSPLAYAIDNNFLSAADIIIKHMLVTHAVTPSATQKDIIIFADVLARLIIKKSQSTDSMAKYDAIFDCIVFMLKSPSSRYPVNCLQLLLDVPLSYLDSLNETSTLFTVALKHADEKAIATFKPLVTKEKLGEKGCLQAVLAAIVSNQPRSYFTLFGMQFDLLTDFYINEAVKMDADKFLQFALDRIARRDKYDSVNELLARKEDSLLNGKSLLIAAAQSRASKVVKFLFSQGVSANELDNEGKPIFWHAIQQVGPDLFNPQIKDGITHEVKLNHSDVVTLPGQIMLMSKTDKSALDVVEVFLAQQVDTSYVDPIDQLDCFMVAAQSQNYYLSHLLMSKYYDRVDLDRKNAKQQSLAQVAATNLNSGLLRLILDLRSKRQAPPQLKMTDLQPEPIRGFPDCMLSYLLCFDEKWLQANVARKILKSNGVREEQRIKERIEIIELCENVIDDASRSINDLFVVARFNNIKIFAKMLHNLLVVEVGGELLCQRNAITSLHLKYFVNQAESIISKHEAFLNEYLENGFDDINASLPRKSQGKDDALYVLSSVTLAAYLRLTQYYLLVLSERLLEWLYQHFDGDIDLNLYAETIKLIEQLSIIVGGVFDSLELTDRSRYLFSDMNKLGIDIKEQVNLLDEFKNDIALQKRKGNKVTPTQTQRNSKKNRVALLPNQDEVREIEKNIAKLTTAKQANTSRVLTSSMEPVVDGLVGTLVDVKIKNVTAKKKRKNAKKKAQQEYSITDTTVHDACSSTDPVVATSIIVDPTQSASASKKTSLAQKIELLEARILRRQHAWDASESKKLFNEQRLYIENNLTMLRVIKRDDQPTSPAEFEMKVMTEFKKVFEILKSNDNFYFVGGSVINFRKNIKFNADKYDVDIVGKVTEQSVLDRFRLSLFVGNESTNLYMYKSPEIDLDLLCYKPDVEMDINQDVLRRDYTICSVYMNAKGYSDPTGYGLDDIDNNILRMNGNPEQLKNDPVRLLRGLKYILRGFNPEPRLHAVLMDLDESIFENLDKQQMVTLQVKTREFFRNNHVDWRNVLAHYQLRHRPEPISIFQSKGTFFYPRSHVSLSTVKHVSAENTSSPVPK